MPVAIPIVPIAILGALAILTYYYLSPPGQKASKETVEALERIWKSPSAPEPELKPEPEPKPVSPLPPVTIEKCPKENPRCPCCGREAHSEAQRRGQSISEEEFYTPKRGMKDQPQFSKELENLLPEIRASKCKGLLPIAGTPCGQYYVVTPQESRSARVLYEDHKRNIAEWKGKRIAHRVPLVGGGCPIGPGNTYPVPEECLRYEEKLGELQGKAGEYHRRNPPPPKRC
jgi:hypothetical protein